MKILVKGKVETVSLDRVKPAHLDNEPAIGTAKQRKTQTNTKNLKTQTRSVAVQHGTNLATTSHHNAN